MKKERKNRLMLIAGIAFLTYSILNIMEFSFPNSLIKALLAAIFATLVYAFFSSNFWKKYILKVNIDE
ncbi:hypothetical protein [Serratia ficaria]|jgi:uncharacterized membrane protein|uniref:hypothetical protein n=1 Tax=Serratia ficaria TaxID=61651 RepID=UPI0021C6795F|nr:hypothetical protein [Serratia ficaria]